MSFTPALSQRLDEPKAEAVRANMEQQIRELQTLPIAGAMLVTGVSMAPSATVLITHNLGRRVACFPSAIAGAGAAGVIADFGSVDPSGHPNDVTKAVCLSAVGYGATITVDFLLVPR